MPSTSYAHAARSSRLRRSRPSLRTGRTAGRREQGAPGSVQRRRLRHRHHAAGAHHRQPSNYRDLAHQLAQEWPAFAAYAVSFSIIGIMWLNHHSIFGHFSRVDRPLAYLNLLLLMTVVFIPFPTGVFGEALHRGNGATAAAVAYSITMALNSYVWTALWLYASTRRRLLESAFPEEQRAISTVLFAVGVVAYTVALGIAFLNAYACLAFHGLMAVYYALDPVSRRAARRA